MFCGKCGTQLNADGTCPKCRSSSNITTTVKYSLQGTTQGNGLTGGLPPVRFSM